MILSELIEITSQRFNAAAIQILSESGLPAYLVEGMVLELLADIREKKAAELTQELSDQNMKLEKQNEELQKCKKELELQLKDAREKLYSVPDPAEDVPDMESEASPKVIEVEKSETGGEEDGGHKQ